MSVYSIENEITHTLAPGQRATALTSYIFNSVLFLGSTCSLEGLIRFDNLFKIAYWLPAPGCACLHRTSGEGEENKIKHLIKQTCILKYWGNRRPGSGRRSPGRPCPRTLRPKAWYPIRDRARVSKNIIV